jgi:hypothetical protein
MEEISYEFKKIKLFQNSVDQGEGILKIDQK